MTIKHKPNPEDAVVTKRRTKSTKHQGRRAAPSAMHGTKVRFNITCARCGKDDTLSFVPRTTGDILCSTCAAEEFGPDWAHGRRTKKREKTLHTIVCPTCGREDKVPFKPTGEREVLCRFCHRGEEVPAPDRIRRATRVDPKEHKPKTPVPLAKNE